VSEQARGLSQTLRATLRLRELVLEGELRGGERISELPLAAQLGVSRTPLRLALARLEHEGLLEQAPGGGFAVCSFTLEEVVDAIDLRGVLEGTAARLAAERLERPDELEAMHGCVAQLDAVVRPDRPAVEAFERYVELNERFHTLLLGLARSRALDTAYAGVLALPFASPSAFVRLQSELPESHRILYLAHMQHRGILEAIEHREGTRAEALAREHARLARRNLDVVLGSERVLERLPGAGLIRTNGSH
jgi:GntR family transcriptional regulator, vanillate catabolism transcriptional regulator